MPVLRLNTQQDPSQPAGEDLLSRMINHMQEEQKRLLRAKKPIPERVIRAGRGKFGGGMPEKAIPRGQSSTPKQANKVDRREVVPAYIPPKVGRRVIKELK